jgi:hypothetical protein
MNEAALSPEIQDRQQRRATMRLSVAEGMFAMIAIGFQQTFYVPFLNALGADKLQIGIGAGIPALMTGLIQLGVPQWLEKTKSYKKVMFYSTLAHGLSFIPLAAIAYLHGPVSVWSAIACMAVSSAAMGFGAGCWADWMAMSSRENDGASISEIATESSTSQTSRCPSWPATCWTLFQAKHSLSFRSSGGSAAWPGLEVRLCSFGIMSLRRCTISRANPAGSAISARN